jgi:hypothetical protein
MEVAMDTPPEPQRIFRCPRCRHVDFESVPHLTHRPRCGLAIPRPEREYFERRNLRLMLQQR